MTALWAAVAAAVVLSAPTPGGVGETVLTTSIDSVAVASAGAVRLDPPSTTTTTAAVPGPIGFAPPDLTGCAEFRWYRQAFGLPAAFDSIAWRESNCRNEDGVRTFCCYGYLQLNVSVHLADARLGWRYRDNCGVYSYADVNSDTPEDKWRQVCAAAQLYAVNGLRPWQ